ncbi:RNA polymerase sigma factor [Gilvimarinus algae]|uniref:Sigma-70 family RNA polymerase sigma factor n=1 Tax=Gilvimarinus algae TaxID=3058037 RepID=A0ABT8T9D0_9GAMM|nr:sigma-70 family RNA polymerase sigma factor [Gilvimarinus sp. SDUM040014]MDO3380702.1 sigma-70 family RNA polymerase sigma factor [Gilvimarinus sp. SDUM040014]
MHYSRGIEQFYFKALGLITRTVGKVVPPDDVEDIVQETYVKACQIRGDHSIQNPQAFLVRMARNLALDHVKRAEFRLASSLTGCAVEVEAQLTTPEDATVQVVASDEEFANFCEAVRQLPLQSRRAFVLKKVYGYSQKEIAKKLGISESTVEKHIATGLQRSRQYMKEKTMADSARVVTTRGRHD